MEISTAAPDATPRANRTATRRGRLPGAGLACASLLLLILCFTGSAAASGTKPVITEQPKSVAVETGQPASFKSTATATPNPTVQWESSFDGGKTWKEITGAKSTTYTIAKTENNQNSLQYRAKFLSGTLKLETVSEAATLTVGTKPVVEKSPSSATVAVGQTALFEASAKASPPAEIQWELSTDSGNSWSPLAGEVFPYLLVTPPSGSYDGYEYRARFTNVLGSVLSGVATLKVHALAKVTLQPQDVTVLAGEGASFESAQTGGYPEPTVQWEVSSDGGASWSGVPGANADRLTISPALAGENGYAYRAAFSNDLGTVFSQPGYLFVAAHDYGAFGWGLNTHGQVGVGSLESAVPSPTPINGLSLVIAVSGGLRHSLALLANETVESWGFNSHGQLGDEGAVSTRSPIPVENLKHVIAIAAGGNHSLALLSNGTVKAWGDDESGQLGNGKNLDSEVPVTVEGLSNVTAIAAGEEHSLALLANGTVMAWGGNERGQLAVPGKGAHNTPVEVKGLSEVTAIAADGQFSMALLKNGTVVAWGDDLHGQLGNKEILEGLNEKQLEEGVYTNSPVPVEGLTGVKAIAAGRSHALALLEGGTVEAWGNDSEGELGNGIIEPQADTPVPVPSLLGVSAISAGDQESVAVLSSGAIDAWGSNGSGALGIGTTGSPSDVPVEVHSIAGAAGVSAGGGQVLAFGATLPTVTGVSPHSGPTGGGQTVTITGSGLAGASAVHFGVNPASGIVDNPDGSLTVSTPAGTGTVDVTVTTPTGTSVASGGDRYAYRPAPTVRKLSAKGGSARGGTSVIITGTEFTDATRVYFGSVAVNEPTVDSATEITVVSPANVGGALDVRVETPSGLSAITTKDKFKYAPAVEGVEPAFGPKAGGGSVTITGYGFLPGTSGTAFKFGKAKVTSYECSSSTSCTVIVPAAKAAGTVDVLAQVGTGKSPVVPADHYTYE